MAIVRTLWNFITALKNTVGNLLFLALLGLIIFALFSQQRIQVPESAVLIIDPEGLIVNQKRAVDPIEGFLTGGQAEAVETLGRDIIDAIRSAADDERIKGIVLDLSKLVGSSLSLYDEIGRELLTFKQTDKPVYAFGSSYSQTQYFLAAYADKIYVDADAHSFLGAVFLQGFGSYPLYVKDALDKLSLSMHVFKAGEFKDAAETLTRQSMSEYSREANQLLVDSLWQQYLGTVSEQRGISAHAISNYIENYAEIMDAADANFKDGKDLGPAQGILFSVKDIFGAEGFPIQPRQIIGNRAPIRFGQRQPQQMLGRLIVPRDVCLGIQHHHAILNRVKKRPQEIPLPRQALHHRLQPIGIELVNPPDNSVKKAVFFSGHYS